MVNTIYYYIKLLRPLNVMTSALAIIISTAILEELNSKEYSEESLKFLNHMCKNICDISFCDMPDDFYLYKSIAKDACNCLPREIIMNDIFKSYRIKKKLFPRKSYYTL